MYTWAKMNKHVAEMPLMRWATTAMAGADGYVNSSMASMVARIRAYDNLASRESNLLLKRYVLQKRKSTQKCLTSLVV